MKSKSTRLRLLPLLGASALLALAVGCSKNDKDAAAGKIEDAYRTSTAVVSSAWDDLKDYTFDKSQDFQRRAEAISSELDAKIAKLKADYSSANASSARKAAMDRLTSAQATLSEKMAALKNASAATWDSAKAEVLAASKQLAAAYEEAVADAAND